MRGREKMSSKSHSIFTCIVVVGILLTVIVVAESFFYIQLKHRYNALNFSYEELKSEYDSIRSLYDELNTSYHALNNSYFQLLNQCEGLDVKYGDITVKQAKRLIETKLNLVIVDVRTSLEYETGHIEGSINLCLTCYPEILLNNLNPNDEILLYCKAGMRSANAMRILKENGYYKVYNMLGGIEAWRNAGYPVIES